MQSLQAMSKTPAQSANLPPLQNLPSWSRNSFGRRKQLRSIGRDRLQPIKSIQEDMEARVAEDATGEKSNYSGRIVSAPSRGHGLDQEPKSDIVEKRIEFLRAQHAETLSYLHKEIERLKAENKDLSFKLVMAKTGVNLHKDTPSPNADDSAVLNAVDLGEKGLSDAVGKHKRTSESEKGDKVPLHQSVQDSTNMSTGVQPALLSSANSYRRHRSEKKVNPVKPDPTPLGASKGATTKDRSSVKTKAKDLENPEKKQASSARSSDSSSLSSVMMSSHQGVPLGQSLVLVTVKDKTVRVHVPADGAPRSPTLLECKAIIKHQQETNQRQQKELSKLKSDLSDALYADKWTPDAYLLAKSYMTDDVPSSIRQNTPATRSLPRLQSREQLTRSGRLTSRVEVVQDSISLPVLRPNAAAASVALRKRRQQAVVRGRGKRDFF